MNLLDWGVWGYLWVSWGCPLASVIVFISIFEGILEPKGLLCCPNGGNKGSQIFKKLLREGSEMEFEEHVGKRRKIRCQMGRKTTVRGIANVAQVQ